MSWFGARGDVLFKAGKPLRPSDVVSHVTNRETRMVVIGAGTDIVCRWVDLHRVSHEQPFNMFELFLEERDGWDPEQCPGCGSDCGGCCPCCGRV